MNVYVGQILYGYCNGYFGRDSYSTKRVEGVGVDWIVAREEGKNYPVFAYFEYGRDEMEKSVSEWSVKDKEDD